MNIIFILIPLSLILVGIIILAFFWSISSGQFDDLEGPAHSVLMDDDEHRPDPPPGDTRTTRKDATEEGQ